MAETHNKPAKRNWYGVRPVFLVAGAVALLGFGVISGVAFDLATRPEPKPPRLAMPAKPSHTVEKTIIKLPDDMPAESASIFDKSSSRTVAAAQPLEPQRLAAAVPPPGNAGQVVVAVVIDDLGVDRARAQKMLTLPGPLTLSMMTYATDLNGLVGQARKGGHEVMAHLPMEPIDPKENPGPGALRANMDPATIRKTVAADLDGWSGYVGVNNHMGSKFTKDQDRMTVVMEELKARGLMWLDSKTIGDSKGSAAAKAAGVPYIERDVFIDNIETVAAVNEQLDKLIATAKTRGSAIAIGHPHDSTYEALKAWLPTLAARGVTLVPVTEVLRRRDATSK